MWHWALLYGMSFPFLERDPYTISALLHKVLAVSGTISLYFPWAVSHIYNVISIQPWSKYFSEFKDLCSGKMWAFK